MSDEQQICIELRTYDENKVLRLDNIKQFSDSSGGRCDVVVNSNGFRANRRLFFSQHGVEGFLRDLVKMNKSLKGSATLKEDYEPQYVKLEMQNLGHLLVTGELWELSFTTQHLTFCFETDQTCLTPLIEDLQHLIKTDQ